MGKGSKYAKVTARQGWLSVLPVLVVILLIRGYPLIVGLCESFTNWNGMNRNDFIGFKNYMNILKDPVFWDLLKNNIIFLLFIPIQLIVGIVVAVLFYDETPGWKFFRNVFYLPQIISSVVIGYLFSVFFSYRGPVNAVLKVFGFQSREWLGEKGSAIIIDAGILDSHSHAGKDYRVFLRHVRNMGSDRPFPVYIFHDKGRTGIRYDDY